MLAASLAALGDRATVQAVRDALAGAGRSHLAIHGRFDPHSPLDSAFYAADGRLTLADLLSGGVTVAEGSIVIASACETGLYDISVGSSEQMGFAAALLSAGARTVIATLWPINDLSTVLVMHRALKGEQQGWPAAMAEATAWLRCATRAEVAHALFEIAALLHAGDPDSQALITDAIELVLEGEATPFAHPQYWAPFAVSGAG